MKGRPIRLPAPYLKRVWLDQSRVPDAAVAITLVAGVAALPAAAADAEHGKVVFQTCAACHSDKPDAIGPSLRGRIRA